MSDDLTKLSLSELREFAEALETFKANIEKRCNHMENGMNSCSKYMKDETSQQLLRKSAQSVAEIRECLNPTTLLLEKVYRMIDILTSGFSMGV